MNYWKRKTKRKMASDTRRLMTMNVLVIGEVSANEWTHRMIEKYRTNNEHMIKHRLLGSCTIKDEIE